MPKKVQPELDLSTELENPVNSCKHSEIRDLEFDTLVMLRCIQKRQEFRLTGRCATSKRRVEVRYRPMVFRVLRAELVAKQRR